MNGPVGTRGVVTDGAELTRPETTSSGEEDSGPGDETYRVLRLPCSRVRLELGLGNYIEVSGPYNGHGSSLESLTPQVHGR